TSYGIESGNGTTELAGTTASSLQAPDAGKKATLRPCFNPRAGSTFAPTSLTTPAPSNPGTRPSEAIVGVVPNAGEPMIRADRLDGSVRVVDDSSHMNLQRLPAQPAARYRGATGRYRG